MSNENKQVNFQLTEEEALALIDTLDVARLSFANIIKAAGDNVSEEHLKQIVLRMNLCGKFMLRLSANLRIGEPIDNNVH